MSAIATKRTTPAPKARARAAGAPGRPPRAAKAPPAAAPRAADAAPKAPFDIDEVMARVRRAVEPFAKAALFELAEDGFGSPFEQLVACIVSIRTYDETTLPASRRLFAEARTPAAVRALGPERVEALIRPCTFADVKAKQICAIAERVEREFGGQLPCDFETLTSFRGVGPKCASLALGIACGQSHIGVDVHVHRVTNRWGYVRGRTPEATRAELERVLPKKYWVEINRLLVPFGKHVCRGALPACSTCPVLRFCRQEGVARHA
ncbi:MAG TPA: endonuclease III [Polyangiaceae bacterium]|nr:endonuclease III [Polyangiaceae bacterium]